MKNKTLLAISALFLGVQLAGAQGTAITYQGRFLDNGSPATGSYDMRFQLHGDLLAVAPIGSNITVAPVSVNNGLFRVVLDFGPGIFTGPGRWLEIGVRTNGSVAAHTNLSPRQALLPVPYAITASNLTGTLPATQLTGTVPSGVLAGANGSGLTSLNASQLTSGTVPDALLSTNVALLNANQTFSGANTFSALATASGALSLNGTNLYLKGTGGTLDLNHGLGYYGGGTTFGEYSPDGPVLFGYSGGVLGYWQYPNPGVPVLTWKASGNVGIGTTTPGDLLSLNGGALSFQNPATPWNPAPYVGMDYDSESDALRLRANVGSGALNTTLMTIKRDGGNVGIGTAAPGKALQVGDPAVPSEGMIRLGSSLGSAHRVWDMGVPQADETTIGYSFVIQDTARPDPDFIIRWNSGNVGIGTNNPQAKLDVSGAIRATSFSGPGAMPWQVVSGTSVQAQPNAGYLLNGFLIPQQTVTLPTAPNVGDVVRISSAGPNWKLAQNSGQAVISQNFPGGVGVTWVSRAEFQFIGGLASSADGTRLVAVGGFLGGLARWDVTQMAISADGGYTWNWRDYLVSPNDLNTAALASSANGGKLVSVGLNAPIHTSADYGATWTMRASAGSRDWRGVASSADGTKLVAVASDDFIYTSADSGATWNQTASIDLWQSVASSTDGTKLVAVASGGFIYASANSGQTWATRVSAGSRNWRSVACSSDGINLVAVDYGGKIYTSSNFGASWTARENPRNWISVACSADGMKQVAAVAGGHIYISTDLGASWTERDSANRSWAVVVSSADGMRLAGAAEDWWGVSTSGAGTQMTTTDGTAGYLIGSPYSAIELQHVGGGRFVPLSHEGVIIAY